jgi:multidrug resistance efflux pump
MIVVLLLAYLTAIWLIYFKLRLLPFNLVNKVSIALLGVVTVAGLFLATSYCHPYSKDVRVIRYVIPIATYLPKPAMVTDVPVEPNRPVKKGDVLLKLDSRPYQYEVNRLEAALVAANIDQPRLEADLEAAKANLAATTAQLDNFKLELSRQEKLVETNSTSDQDYQNAVTQVRSGEAALRQAIAALDRADLTLQSKIDEEFTSVTQVREQLSAARLNLEQTTVLAPEDGFVVNLAVRPGIMASPAAAIMSFVSTEKKASIIATFSQNPLKQIQAGSPVEVVFNMFPGRVFKAEVETLIEMTGQGQVAINGQLPEVLRPQPRGRFAIRLKLSDEDVAMLPGGAGGSCVVYTNSMRPLGIIQKMGLRMEGYLNFVTGR